MCNINVLFVKKKVNNITPFLQSVSAHSFVSNSDGEGIYIKSLNKVYKNEDKMNLFKYEDAIEKSNVIISHQRLSTSGFELKYNHPFENKDFVLVHNGIINQFKNGSGSDTFGFWNRFNEEFNLIKSHLSREDKIKKVITDLFERDIGSYSILIYDKITDKSFYFKGAGYPSIHFYSNDEYLFITTNQSNEIFLTMLTDKKFASLDIKDRHIYKISKDFICYNFADLPKEKENNYLKDYDSNNYIGSSKKETQLNLAKGNCCICECKLGKEEEYYAYLGGNICYECWQKENVIGGYNLK